MYNTYNDITLLEQYTRDNYKIAVYSQNGLFKAIVKASNGITLTTALRKTIFEVKRDILNFIRR